MTPSDMTAADQVLWHRTLVELGLVDAPVPTAPDATPAPSDPVAVCESKAAYTSRSLADRVAENRSQATGWRLAVYRCPVGPHYHPIEASAVVGRKRLQ